MKNSYTGNISRICLVIATIYLFSGCITPSQTRVEETKIWTDPAEDYFIIRAYPALDFPYETYMKIMKDVSADLQEQEHDTRSSSASWQMEGPLNISGRMNTIAVHPDSSTIMLVGLACGGIFKTVDNGANWYPVFDAFAFLSIGHIVYDPVNPMIVYAGTGDPNISGYPFIGDGIYKSVDGGETWNYSGLSETGIITKIIVHPSDDNIIYAAAMGLPFIHNEDRGLYKSIDAGLTWNKVLYVADDAGIIDIVSDPANADIIYAASWNRIRNNHESYATGSDALIWKSTDGGDNWNVLNSGLPIGSQSRISLEMRADNANVLYASYVNNSYSLRGIYKTINGGSYWDEINTDAIDDIYSGFGWYFDGIQLNPENPDDLFVLGVGIERTSDDGDDWDNIDVGGLHADKHAMHFISANNYLLATDGGLYRTTNNASTWSDIENIPSAQFYHVDINPHEDKYWGGLQDNGTNRGSAAAPAAWADVYGGDGFHSEFRSDMDDVFYVEYQNGGIVGYDGSSFFSATSGISGSDRRNWNMPYQISKHNDDVIYAGTYRMYKSTDGIYPDFNVISYDLTDGIIYATNFHTITTFAESDFEAGVLYVGTVDANVWRTLNDGTSWTNISAGLPVQYVTDLEVSHVDTSRIFVSNSGYKENDFVPHLHRSDDYGNTWTDISGDLPELAVNAIVVHPETDDYIFVATDGGVYFTINGGVHWERLGDNMPVIPVYDLEFDADANSIVAGTFARSVWSINLDGMLVPNVDAGDDVVICSGESITLTASGAYSYVWSPVVPCDFPCDEVIVSPLENTTYVVTGTDAFGLTGTDTISVNVESPPIATITVIDYALVASGEDDYSYLWFNLADETTPISVNDTIWINFSVATEYMVVVTNAFGCSDTAFQTILGADIIDNFSFINISPVPANTYLNISISDDRYLTAYWISDMNGIRVRTVSITSKEFSIPLDNLPSGTYFLNCIIGNQYFVKTFQTF